MKTLPSMITVALLAASCAAYSEPPPANSEHSVYQLQSRWTTDAGRNLRLAELGGRYQIVAFIFTHCGGACPLLVKSLQLQSRDLPPQVRERARFLLVSMDPERDTTKALRAYRQDLALDEQWTLLRGSDPDVRELAAVLGFNYERTPDGDFAHSNQITLLNPSGEVVLQHPQVEGAVSAVSMAIACADPSSTTTRPHIAGKNCR